MAQSRLPKEYIQQQYKSLQENLDFITVFSQLPDMALVINQNRQIVYGNQKLLDDLGLRNVEESLSYRPGELFKCIHASNGVDCGDSVDCRYCQAFSVVKESQTVKRTVSREARVTVRPLKKSLSLDLKVTASPLSLNNFSSMTMVFFSDISHQKRREYLEEVFLHDTRNTLNILSMMGEMMSFKDLPGEVQGDFLMMQQYVKMLAEDFEGHQMLLEAEKGVLKSQLSLYPVHEILSASLEAISKIAQFMDVKISLECVTPPENVHTDPRLARRVLVNAMKNAIEATPEKGKIKIRVFGGKNCVIEINNPGYLDECVSKQIFQRSFSTKGQGRGLGTYSMRLLLESYLEGKVSFSSSKKKGTTFVISLPTHPNSK
jgi:signal transduction histidine kinase